MPRVTQIFILEVTPVKFIDNCSAVELQEVILLANARLDRLEQASNPQRGEQKSADDLLELDWAEQVQEPAALPIGEQTEKVKEKSYWTPEEDGQLRKLYPTTKAKDLALQMNRSNRAITQRAGLLGIGKNKKGKLTAAPKEGVKASGYKKAKPGVLPEAVHGFNSFEEVNNRRSQAKAALQKVKQREADRPMRSLRVDKRTTVLVPAGTNDAEYIKNYKKKMGL